MKSSLKYVVRDKDRHGNIRLYFRKDGRKFRLRGPDGSDEFFTDYTKALSGNLKPTTQTTSVGVIKPDSFRALCVEYFKSSEFKKLASRGQRVRRGILERFCQNNNDGDKQYGQLEPKHLRIRRDAMMDRPEAANNMLKAVRQVFKFAMNYQDFDRNPAAAVEYLAGNPDGFHAWSLEEIAKFEKHHPIGTPARLALALALYTGQRRADIVALGPSNIVVRRGQEWLSFTQTKNRANKPVHLEIPLIQELRTVVDATGTGDQSFLVTAFGKPFTSNGFGNRFRKWCDEAKLPHCSAHGLRKAAAARLAESGCTEQEIMAITGHSTSKEVVRYTRSAKQQVRAANAMAKVSPKLENEEAITPIEKENTQ